MTSGVMGMKNKFQEFNKKYGHKQAERLESCSRKSSKQVELYRAEHEPKIELVYLLSPSSSLTCEARQPCRALV
ncbi:hypothetical protein HanIR_Chr16g0794561 [Helianthus annuus]|nr:hypothetical protein HanIR_Chr16g0794561 [Helianthus annuus]